MLIKYLPQLGQKRIVLASQSPRRHELLRTLGLKFEVSVSTFDEKLPHSRFPSGADYAMETAKHKALEVAMRIPAADLVIGADTVVEYNGKILEKPDDSADAVRMVTSLSGSSHHVHTGVVLVWRPAKAAKGSEPLVRKFSSTTNVVFDELDAATIQAYVESGEPFGKAGAYGIQGIAGSFVRCVDGCYFNVMGFPLNAFCKEMVDLIDNGDLDISS